MIYRSELTRSNIQTIIGAVANDYDGQRAVIPQWKRGMSNCIVNSSSGDYDGGDRVIGYGSYEVDGDILITTGWGDGIAFRRLNNDGTLTKLWHSDYGLYRDSSSTYNHLHGVAIHKATSQAVFMTHNVNGHSWMDYSDLKAGGTNVINERPSSQYIFTNGVNIDRMGTYYTNGLVTAGDWLYVGDYDATHYKKFPRINWRTGEQQLLDTSSNYSGSASIDRNGYRYSLYYDEVNDRVYFSSYYNGNFMLIVDASTANPKLVWCDASDAGMGDDGYETGLFVPDPINNPNLILMGCNSRNAYMDIGPCFTGSRPTILKQFYTEDGNTAQRFGSLHRAGTKYQSINDEHTDKNPLYPDMCPCPADRGRNMLDGWIDWDNNRIVGVYRHNNTTEDTTSNGRGRSYRADYSPGLFRMRSANGTPYWIKLGYGYDGHSFKVWTDDIGPDLVGNWEVQYGTYTTDGNIDFVHFHPEGHFVPSGCSISYYVSNNNGSTWELYTATGENFHTFNSSGNQLKIKYVASGLPNKGPYKMSTVFDVITYGTLYESMKNPAIPHKVSRFKIRGKKS